MTRKTTTRRKTAHQEAAVTTAKRQRSVSKRTYHPRAKGLLGISNADRDRRYHAKRPGRRVSASNRVYYERRRNRADAKPAIGL